MNQQLDSNVKITTPIMLTMRYNGNGKFRLKVYVSTRWDREKSLARQKTNPYMSLIRITIRIRVRVRAYLEKMTILIKALY